MDMNIGVTVHTGGAWGPQGSDGTQGTQGAQGSGGTVFRDEIELGNGLKFTFTYNTSAQNPALPNPNLQGASTLAPQHYQQQEYSSAHAYYDAVENNINQLIEQHGLNEEQTNKLVQSFMNGVPSDDNFINQLVSDLDGMIAGELAQEYDLPSTQDQATALKNRGQDTVNSGRQNLQALQEQVNNMEDGPEKQALQQFIDNAEQQLSDLEGSLSNLNGDNLGDNLGELEGKLESFNQLLNDAENLDVSDPNVRAALAQVTSQTRDGVSSLRGSVNDAQLLGELANGNWSALDGGLRNLSQRMNIQLGLTDLGYEGAELQRVLEALINPESAESIGVDYEAALAKLAQQLGVTPEQLKQIIQSSQITSTFSGIVSAEKDMAFEELVDGYDVSSLAEELGMTEDEVRAMLKHSYYGLASPGGKLGALVGELEGQALSQIMSEFGVSSEFASSLPKGSSSHAGVYNQEFLRQFDAAIRNSGLTPEQQNQVRQALADPTNPNISAETKALIQQLYNQVVGAVKQQYGLPDDWSPDIGTLGELNNISTSTRALWNTIEAGDEALALAAASLQNMPEGPERALLMNVLALVSKALSALKEQIARIKLIDSEMSKDISEAEKDAALYRHEVQMKKLEEMKEKKEKMGPLMDFMKIFGPIMAFVTLVLLTAVAGPVGFAIGMALFVDSIMNAATGEGFIKPMFDAIMDAIVSVCEAMGMSEELANAIAFVIVALAMVVGAAMLGGGLAFLELFFASGILERFLVETCGMSEMAAAILSMCIQLVIEIIIMIVLTVVTGGAAAPLLVANITAKVAQATAKAVQVAIKVVQMIQKVVNATSKVGQVMQKIINKLTSVAQKLTNYADDLMRTVEKLQKAIKAGDKAGIDEGIERIDDQINFMKRAEQFLQGSQVVMGVAQGAAGTALGVIRGQLAEAMGELDAIIAELEALIKVLRKVIEQLLQGLEGMGTWMAEIGNQQSKMWGDLSQTATAVAEANAA